MFMLWRIDYLIDCVTVLKTLPKIQNSAEFSVPINVDFVNYESPLATEMKIYRLVRRERYAKKKKHGESVASARCISPKDHSAATQNTKLTLLRSGGDHWTLPRTCGFFLFRPWFMSRVERTRCIVSANCILISHSRRNKKTRKL